MVRAILTLVFSLPPCGFHVFIYVLSFRFQVLRLIMSLRVTRLLGTQKSRMTKSQIANHKKQKYVI